MTSNKPVDILRDPRIQGPAGPYRTIYLDPPWPERGGGKSKRGADRHYPVMSVDQIGSLLDRVLWQYGSNPVTHVADDAHCWMWVTDNYLANGIDLMDFLGFKYKRTLVWVKVSPGNIAGVAEKLADVYGDYGGNIANGDTSPITNVLEGFINARKGGLCRSGLGQYARGSHEILLFGTRGKAHMPPTDARPKSVQFAPISEHSRKPELFADIIEACSPGPRLEMFARRQRPGWAVFGNEVDDG